MGGPTRTGGTAPRARHPSREPARMRLTWYGQAAFRLVRDDGFAVICDPYTPELLGYPPIRDGADLVLTSSADDEAHCRHDLVPGEHRWLNALDAVRAGGTATAAGLEVRAIEAMEIGSHPLHAPGQNAMYRFEIDGLSIAHMGDIGEPLSERQTRFLDGADVLLALAGGELVIELPELLRVIGETRPRLVVPMHFRTLTYRPRSLLWIESFLALVDDEDVDFACDSTVELFPDTLPASGTRVLVMDYVR